MWLPAPLYESLPYTCILIGILFISGTLYIGVSAPGATLYLACGLISTVYGAVVFVLRQTYRSAAQQIDMFETA
jgi:hypothetical protein